MLKLLCKGFAMGLADIVPGVSGGTVAFITGIYFTLIKSISSVDLNFIKLILNLKFKEAFEKINLKFLAPLLTGIFLAIVLMSRVMHYLMNNYEVYTWSLFFGLVLASIIYIGKQIDSIKSISNLVAITLGSIIGFLIVSLIPVETSDSAAFIFLSGMIAICAMILPGISGSFLLLILGKYAFVTGALKNPFNIESLKVIIIFSSGCLVGLLSFSKVLNILLKKYQFLMMSFLTGFMIGSLKKIWPWKEVIEKRIIRGKEYVINDSNFFPSDFSEEALIGFTLMIIGFCLVFFIEWLSRNKPSESDGQ